MIPFTVNTAAKTANALNGLDKHRNCHFLWGDHDHHLTHGLLGRWNSAPKWHLDGFSRLCVHCRITHNAFEWTRQPPKLPLPLGDLDRDLITVPRAHQSQSTNYILIGSAIFEGSRTWPTDRQTDKQTDRQTTLLHR